MHKSKKHYSSRLGVGMWLMAFLLLAASCSPYNPVLKPLRHIPPDCYCRYAKMATLYYDFKVSELLEFQDFTRRAARDSAIILTHAFIAEVQLNITERDCKKMCNCFELRRRYGDGPL